MKTERRHELKHNSLDTELVKVLDYLKKNGKSIILAVLVLVAVISVGWVFIQNRNAAASGPRLQYDNLKTINTADRQGRSDALAGFEELAEQSGNPKYTALGCVEAGDICMAQYMAGDPVTGALAQAQKNYQRVISEFSDNMMAVGRAHLGLAKLAEGEERFADARSHYQQVITLGQKTSSLATAEADRALKVLDGLGKSVLLATSRPATPTPPTPPTTQPDSPTTQPDSATTKPAATTTAPAATTTKPAATTTAPPAAATKPAATTTTPAAATTKPAPAKTVAP